MLNRRDSETALAPHSPLRQMLYLCSFSGSSSDTLQTTRVVLLSQSYAALQKDHT